MRAMFSKIAGVTGYAIQYYCIAHCTFEYLGDLVICSGPSMEPTIYSDNILFTEHVTPKLNRLDRGDIVIAKCPSNPKQQICKRIKGMPGDKVKVGFTSVEVVPLGHVWLEGDNFYNSSDSRTYGPVPLGLIRSRAVCRVWPFKERSMLKD